MVLAGATSGRQLLANLISQESESSESEVLNLDFDKIEVATASYLREGIITFRDYCRSHRSNLYPVLTNMSEPVIEEIAYLLRAIGDAMVVCVLDNAGEPAAVQLLGHLDEKQRQTLDAVVELGQADASTLASRYQDKEKVGPTAWNNRLAALASKGLVIERQRGRAKFYRPVMEGM